MLKLFPATFAAVALTCAFGTSVRAATADHHTRFTFSQPVALPGVTLAAGTYVFRLADPATDRQVVQVLDRKGQSLALLNAIPSYRPDASDEPSVGLMETVPGMATAVKTWWPQGETMGFEFVYPQAQLMKLTGVTPAEPERAGQTAATTLRPAPSSAARRVRQAAASTQSVVAGPGLPTESLPSGSSVALIALVTLLGAFTVFGGVWALGSMHKSKA